MVELSILNLIKYDKVFIFIFLTLIISIIDTGILITVRYNKKKNRKPLTWLATLQFTTIISILIWTFFFKSWNTNIMAFNTMFIISSHLFCITVSKLSFLSIILLSLLFKKFRSLFLSIGLIFSILCFLILEYANIYGRFNYEVRQNYISTNLLSINSKLRIVQISDLHIGTFIGHESKLDLLVENINAQDADLVFITGDIINCFAEELIPFKNSLKRIKAKYGKFAVLGNHDYGDYFKWDKPSDKMANQSLMKYLLKDIDIVLLENDNEKVKIKETTISVVGVENWGLSPFRKAANFNKAIHGISNDGTTIFLLSHDPVYWDKIVKFKHWNVITFSGHTHGYQLGIKFSNNYYSPFANKKPWYGFYQYNNSVLYVSKGIGGSFYPGRIGMWPEISVFNISNNNHKKTTYTIEK